MNERRWFPIHLSTAIVVVLTAAVLVWANVRPTVVRGPTFEYRDYGWPQECFWVGKDMKNYISTTGPVEDSLWRWDALGIDVVVALGILGAVILICEVIARRVKAKDTVS